MALQHLRSSTANKRPDPASMSDGQLAINTNLASPGVFFKDSNGDLVKAGPVHVGSTAPNATPASGGTAGNSTGELWLDTSLTPNELKTWNGSAWVSATGQEIPVSKLIDGSARQLLQTDAAGTGVEWTSNVDVPGTLDVTSTATFDSIASHPLGSASAPTITFTGDTNTGIYSPGADQLALSTNGTGRLFVDSSGRISLGAASTTHDFDILKTSSGATTSARIGSTAASGVNNATLILNSGGTGNSTLRFDYENATNYASISSASSSQNLIFGTGGNERMRLDSSGRLGIGSSAPNCQLTNTGTTSLGTNAWPTSAIGRSNGRAIVGNEGQLILWNETVGAGNSGQLYIGTKSGSNSTDLGYARISAGTENASNLASFFKLETMNSSGTLGTGLYLDSSQRVGIGVTTPQSLVDITATGDSVLSLTSSGVRRYQLIATSDASLAFRDATGSSERARIDSSGRLLVGTSSARSNFYNTTADAGFLLEGTGAQRRAAVIGDDFGAALILGMQKSGSPGGNTIVASGDGVGEISFQGNDGSEFVACAQIKAEIDATPGANDMPGRIVLSTTADGASSPTERMRINSAGGINVGSGVVSSASSNGNIVVGEGIYIGAYNGDNQIRSSSAGGGSATLYIGNAAIQVSSDRRLKENIVDTAVDAAEELKKVRVVDFTWNDPSDLSYNNRNARGIWTGVIAQELVDVFPFAVNAPRTEEDLTIDHDSETRWTVDQDQLVPVLIKGFQQALARIETLEAEVAALKAQ